MLDSHVGWVQAKWFKIPQKDKCISHLKVKKMPTYKWSRRRPKWKALRGSKVKAQAQIKGEGEKAKNESKKPYSLGEKT
jgi:hypothetical protein